MATSQHIVRQRDFSGGEVVEHAKRRDDEPVVRAACRAARNVHILSSGALEQRPGRSALFQEDGNAHQVRVAAETVYKLCFGDGDLTIRDKTKPVTMKVTYLGTVTDGQGRVKTGWKGVTTINRFDYDVLWDRKLDTGGLVVSREAEITVRLEMVKQDPGKKG